METVAQNSGEINITSNDDPTLNGVMSASLTQLSMFMAAIEDHHEYLQSKK